MNDAKIDINEFAAQVESELKLFKEFWLKGRENSPKYYPEKMGFGDFFEHFTIFDSSDSKE